MANKQVNAILSLKDKFSVPLFKVADNTAKASGQIKSNVAKANRAVRKVEKTMDKYVKKGFKWAKRLAIIGGGLSLKVGWDGLKELDAGAKKVKSIAKDALRVPDIKSGLLDISGKTGVSVEDISEAQYMAISSSVDPKESLKYAELAVKMQKAGFANAREAIDLVTSMQNAYGESGIQNAYKMADQFLHTQNRGKIEIGQMTQYYGKLIPLFSQAGVGYEEMNAGMATLTKMGMKPAEASTALAGAIRIMMKPTKQTNEALADLGIEFGTTALKAKGFGGIMKEVMEATGGDMDKITRIFPNARAMLAGAALTGKEGMTEFQNILKELQSGVDGSLEEAYGTIQGSIGNQWNKLKQNLKNINTSFYKQHEGNLSKKLEEINDWIDKNPQKIEKALRKIGDAIEWVIDKVITLGKKLYEFRKPIKRIAQILGFLYAGLKILRGIQKLKSIKDVVSGLFGGGVGLGSIALPLAGVAAALFGVYTIAKKVYDIKQKLKDADKVRPAGRPGELDEFGESVYQDAELKDLKDELTDIEDSVLRIYNSIRKLINLFRELKDTIVDLATTVTGISSPILAVVAILFPQLIKIKWAFDAIKNNIDEFVEGLADILEGIEEILMAENLLDFFEGVKKTISGVVKVIRAIWGSFVDFVTAPVTFVLDLLENGVGAKLDSIRQKWETLKELMKHPITGVVKLFGERSGSGAPMRQQGAGSAGARTRARSRRGAAAVDSGVSSRYTGDMSWRGGIVQVHEKGGEILDLPGGTRIFPHDRSVRMAYEEGKSQSGMTGEVPPIVINFNGDLYGETDYIDHVGSKITNRLVKELANI